MSIADNMPSSLSSLSTAALTACKRACGVAAGASINEGSTVLWSSNE